MITHSRDFFYDKTQKTKCVYSPSIYILYIYIPKWQAINLELSNLITNNLTIIYYVFLQPQHDNHRYPHKLIKYCNMTIYQPICIYPIYLN